MATKFNKLSTAAIKTGLPKPVVSAKKNSSGGPGKGLTIVIPPETLVALKTKAAQQSSTVRAIVLAALHSAGYPVPAHELTDRRRTTS